MNYKYIVDQWDDVIFIGTVEECLAELDRNPEAVAIRDTRYRKSAIEKLAMIIKEREITKEKRRKMNMSNKLCGIVWCHGNKDFGVWETDAISAEDQAKIEEILAKYDTTGTSERNAWDSKISDLFSEEY